MLKRYAFRVFSTIISKFLGTPLARAAWKMPGSRRIYGGLMSRLHPDVVEVDGHTMRLDKTDSLLLSVNGEYEATELALFAGCIHAGDTVVDIGAHIGLYSLQAARATGASGHVFCFEPAASNFALLTENVAINGYRNVELIRAAVSDSEGEARLGLSDLNTGDNSLVSAHSLSETVRTVTLDSFFGVGQRIDVVKIDIQGAEPLALAGARRSLADNENLLLFTELSPAHLAGGSEAFLATLSDLGFGFFEISEGDGRVRATSAVELAQMCDGKTDDFHTNLVCARGTEAEQRILSQVGSQP
jgi:FkbM family methyltransferase